MTSHCRQLVRQRTGGLPHASAPLVQLEPCIPKNRNRRQPSSNGSRSTPDHQTDSHLLRISTNPIERSTDVTTCTLPRMDLCSALERLPRSPNGCSKWDAAWD